MTPISAVGIELWSMSNDIYFDNVLVTSDLAVADSWAADTYDLKIQKVNTYNLNNALKSSTGTSVTLSFQLDQNNAGMVRRIINYSNKNPWLYAVYVVVIGLPLVLIITFCCSGKTRQLENMSSLPIFRKDLKLQVVHK